MPTLTPSAAALERADLVPTGIEIEFTIDGEHTVDCDCGAPCCSGEMTEGIDESNYADYSEWLRGWELGEDYGLAEVRSEGPTPLSEQEAALERFRRWFRYDVPGSTEMHSGCSFHVHVNCNHDVGEAVDAAILTRVYREHIRDRARELVAHAIRVGSDWCNPITDHDLQCDGLPPETKYRELSHDPHYGTVELRLWDATDDEDLHRERLSLLREWIALSIDEKWRQDSSRLVAAVSGTAW